MPRVSKSAVGTLLLVVFVDTFQMTFLYPLMPQVVESLGRGPAQIGLLASVTALGQGVAAPFVGSLADRTGRKPILIISTLGCTGFTIATGLARSYEVLLGTRFTSGVFGATASVASAFMADVTSEAERGVYNSYVQVASNLGWILGPLMGGFTNHFLGFAPVCFLAACGSFINFLCVAGFLPESVPPRGDMVAPFVTGERSAVPSGVTSSICKLPCAVWLLALANYLTQIGLASFEALGVLFIQDEFLGDAAAATLFFSWLASGAGAANVVFMLFFYAPLLRCTGIRGSMIVGGLVCVACFVAMGCPIQKWWFFVSVLVFAASDSIMGTGVMTMCTLVADPSRYGAATGVLTASQNFARASGPLFLNWVYMHSKTAPFFINAVLKAISLGVALLAIAGRVVDGTDDGSEEAGGKMRTGKQRDRR